MACRPRSTAAVHFGDGTDVVTDGARRGSWCQDVEVTLTYAQSPTIAAISPPTARAISASQVSVRFQLFDTFPPLPVT